VNDRAFSDPDVRAALAEWSALTRQIAELRRELEEEREVIGLIAAERNDLRAENAALRARLDALRHDLARAQRANRRNDWWATVWSLVTNGRTR
jgi:regulator of replication initiation timing